MADPRDPFLEFIPDELRAEYEATKPKPKKRPPPDLDPTPLAEREDHRRQVGEVGQVRVYAEQQQPTADDYAARLQEAHRAWEYSGYPESGPAVEHLTETLASAYMVAPVGSELENELAAYAERIGAEEVIEAAAIEFDRAVNRHVNAEQGRSVVEALWSRDPTVAAKLAETYEGDGEYLEALAAGDLALEDVREHLGERRAAIEEATLADRRYEERTQLDEAFVRESGLTMDERAEAAYRRELAEATIKATTVREEDVVERRERLLGRSPGPQPASTLADDEAEWKRTGALVDPEDDERRQRWSREAEEAKRAAAVERAEGRQ